MTVQGGGSKLRASTVGDLRTRFKDYYRKQVLKCYEDHRTKIVMALTKKVLDRTPVWEGETIVNWQWSIGTPTSSHVEEVRTPAKPGTTNHGGTPAPPSGEPRRAANEAVVYANMRRALEQSAGRIVDLWLVNNGSIAGLVEYGGAPTPESSRQPAGMLRIAVREVMRGIST